MKISVNWLKEFTTIKGSVDELVVKIGAQLGEVEEVIDLGKRYEGIVVAKVVACAKHPGADKLNVCKIDDGGVVKGVKRDDKGLVQVVCGAPNAREGLMVAWLPPGVIVPSTYDKEQFKLEAREIRGVVSNGMLGSGQELAINDNHDGIIEIDKQAEPGTSLAEVYGLNDFIIDIENKMFTHRPDCFGILGVAREIAGIQNVAFKSPDWYTKSLKIKLEGPELKLDVTNEIPELVPRFMAVPMSGISVKKSPLAMQSYLTRVGLKPINNVVDITNFVMMLTGQPLHAYDYDKVAAQDTAKQASIVVRHPKKGEQVALLNGKTIEPRAEAIMIASRDRLLGVGGVMGGTDTEVDDSTKNIILECANFDMYSIRKTSMAHGLFTDAVTRFNKGQSSLQNEQVLAYAVAWLQRLAHGQVAGKVHDLKHKLAEPKTITITPAFINERLGLDLDVQAITRHLENVEFETQIKGDTLHITPPFWRTDIAIPEDIVEEVGRLYGYDHLPLKLPTRDLTPADKNRLLEFKSHIRDVLADAGANELLTYSFVHGNLFDKVGQDQELAFQLSNALSPDLQYYRLSLTPSLLERVQPNIKAGYSQFALFEINKTHDKSNMHEDGLPIEEERLAFVYAADAKAAKELAGAPYYQAKYYAEHLLKHLGYEDIVFEPTTTHSPKYATGKQALAPFDRARTAYIKSDGKLLGIVGEFTASTRKNLKLPDYVAGFELDVLMLREYAKSLQYRKLSRFPKTEQDISFKVPEGVTYQTLHDVIWVELAKAQAEHGYEPTLQPLDIYQPESSAAHQHMALRITLTHHERTLTTEEVNKLLSEVAQKAHQTLKATRI